jgi:uncharacterized membrane protein YgcG
MSLRLSNLQNLNSPVKPLQQNNGQQMAVVSTPTLVLKDVKVGNGTSGSQPPYVL